MGTRARCSSCGAVFASEAPPESPLRCPVCGFVGPPGGVMRLGLPSLESFARNWQRASAHTKDDDTRD